MIQIPFTTGIHLEYQLDTVMDGWQARRNRQSRWCDETITRDMQDLMVRNPSPELIREVLLNGWHEQEQLSLPAPPRPVRRWRSSAG